MNNTRRKRINVALESINKLEEMIESILNMVFKKC